MPTAEAAIQTRRPVTVPIAVSRAARRPPSSAFFVTIAMSGPGVITIRQATSRNAARCGISQFYLKRWPPPYRLSPGGDSCGPGGAVVAGAEDLDRVGDVCEAVRTGGRLGPALDVRAGHLHRRAAGPADQVVMVLAAAAGPVDLLAVGGQHVGLGRPGHRGQRPVHRGQADPAARRAQPGVQVLGADEGAGGGEGLADGVAAGGHRGSAPWRTGPAIGPLCPARAGPPGAKRDAWAGPRRGRAGAGTLAARAAVDLKSAAGGARWLRFPRWPRWARRNR